MWLSSVSNPHNVNVAPFARTGFVYRSPHPAKKDNLQRTGSPIPFSFKMIHSGKLTWQWKIDPLKMYFLLKMGIFHCYVSLPDGKAFFSSQKKHQPIGRIPGRLRDFLNRLMCTLAVRDTRWVGWSQKGGGKRCV